MIKISNILLPIDYTREDLKSFIKKKLKIGDYDILSLEIIRESIDAHIKGKVSKCITVCARVRGEKRFLNMKDVSKYEKYVYEYPAVSSLNKRPVVVGSGPAGLFCALILAQCGESPIVIERGLDVDSRIKKVNDFFTNATLDTNCNIQFGEGGAGTFSDGKLNTGTRDVRQGKVIDEFILCGAPEDIKINAKPHIGTDKLISVVKNLRKKIIEFGGEFRFDCTLTDLYIKDNTLYGVKTTKGDIETDTLILAIGHSARDTFKMLYEKGIYMERKSFSMGVRIEHPQSLINEMQYHSFKDKLPPADYKAAIHLKDGRGVYTFCMCPGGLVVAAASEKDSVVTNGMSNFARDGKNANSALLCSLNPTDFEGDDVFSGMHFQQKLERSAFYMAGASYKAPAQTVKDFLKGQKSVSLGSVEPTYPIGTELCDLSKLFPEFMTHALREGIKQIDVKLKGFALPDAVLTGVESRSSSPVRIKRDEFFECNIKGIYPCGEGAGYAGGIMSASVDGIRVAEKVLENSRK